MTGGESGARHASGDSTAVLPLAGDDRSIAAFERALTTGGVPIAVYGLGQTGLCDAARLAATTGNVIGAARDGDVVRRLRRGVYPAGIDPETEATIERALDAASFRVVANPAVVAVQASVHLVAVPAEFGTATAQALTQTVRDLATGLAPGDLVCLTATVPPGTSRDVVAPLLTSTSGLDPTAYGLATTPRLLRDGDTATPCRLVATPDERVRNATVRLFERLLDERVRPLDDTRTAEQLSTFAALAGRSACE